jgi:GGDEF domain-containing protein
LLTPETGEAASDALAQRIEAATRQTFAAKGWPISLALGHITHVGGDKTVDQLLREADHRMYAMKREQRRGNSQF